jgi:hypothetical protein
MSAERKFTEQECAQKDAVCDAVCAVWGGDKVWTNAQYTWFGRQLDLPAEQWRRAVNSVAARTLAAKLKGLA